MTGRNRRRYKNDVRLPLILLFFVVGGLVGGRWMRQMRTHHEILRLTSEERRLQHDVHELQRDITDLEGRFSALITRDAVMESLKRQGVTMHKIQRSNVIVLDTPTVGMNSKPEKGGVP